MTYSWAQIDKLAKACIEIAADASDSQGFVPIRNLLKHFQAELVLRPLLVEAMLCEVDPLGPDEHANARARWALLVDSERYAISNESILSESLNSSLPDRFRNTIAHELAHSLAFRAEEFGVKLVLDRKRVKKGKEEEVQDIERETEKMSPLLLIPNETLNRFFSPETPSLRSREVSELRKRLGVSRHVLINRLNLLESYAPHLLTRAALKNVAIGIGKWTKEDGFLLAGWPLFANFDRNIIPSFFHSAKKHKHFALSKALGSKADELANGETHTVCVSAGVEKHPEVENLTISCSIESNSSKLGKLAFFVVSSDH